MRDLTLTAVTCGIRNSEDFTGTINATAYLYIFKFDKGQ